LYILAEKYVHASPSVVKGAACTLFVLRFLIIYHFKSNLFTVFYSVL